MATTENVLSTIRTKLLREKRFGGSPTESQVLVLNPAEREIDRFQNTRTFILEISTLLSWRDYYLFHILFLLAKSLLPKNKQIPSNFLENMNTITINGLLNAESNNKVIPTIIDRSKRGVSFRSSVRHIVCMYVYLDNTVKRLNRFS